MNNNRVVVDLRKVQYAWLWWVNQFGEVKNKKPTQPTVHCLDVSKEDLAYHHPSYPNETCHARAIRLGIIDVWQPKLQLQLTANHSLLYTNHKALSIWKEWNSKIFGKKKKNENPN